MNLETLINAGFALVPLKPGEKGTSVLGWNRRGAAITDIAGLDRIGDGNIGLAHAYCSPSPTCAIDLDDYQLAAAWLDQRGIHLPTLMQAPDAVLIRSGKPNSAKILYRLPLELRALASERITDNGKTILEFRCGTRAGLTVQDVLPPSVHPSGTRYQWEGSGSILSLAEIPPALLDQWSALLVRKSINAPPPSVIRPPSMEETPRNIARVRISGHRDR
jgi:hypothetical protein